MAALVERIAKRAPHDAIIPKRHQALLAEWGFGRDAFDDFPHCWAQRSRPACADGAFIRGGTDFHPGSITRLCGGVAVRRRMRSGLLWSRHHPQAASSYRRGLRLRSSPFPGGSVHGQLEPSSRLSAVRQLAAGGPCHTRDANNRYHAADGAPVTHLFLARWSGPPATINNIRPYQRRAI
jgi:hypothetical protein